MTNNEYIIEAVGGVMITLTIKEFIDYMDTAWLKGHQSAVDDMRKKKSPMKDHCNSDTTQQIDIEHKLNNPEGL